MKRKSNATIFFAALLALLAGCGARAGQLPRSQLLAQLDVPPGFAIEILVDGLDSARSLARGDGGTLFVGTSTAGKVYAVRFDAGGTPALHTLASGLNMPNGVAFHERALYVAEVDRIVRYDDIESRLDRPPTPVLIAELPKERHHGRRYLAFGPDGKLYTAIGAPCNVCDREGFAEIIRMNPDGSARETVARGVRNTVGFDWHPGSAEMWFTDNGRDLLGDDAPPCELNRVAAGSDSPHYGFPFCHGIDIKDPQFGSGIDCARFIAPVQPLGAHVAPLGLRFYTGHQFPAQYRDQAFIAEHGSWNRTRKSGYRISLVRLSGNGAANYDSFASGWLRPDDTVIGRPVDLLIDPDGSLLVSDDMNGLVYRIHYRGNANN
ncbi:MAG: PQQ-dependent sugar dehydrogenase [Steroidobacteraceae bacterium]